MFSAATILFDISLLVVSLSFFVDAVDQLLELRGVGHKSLKASILIVVPFGRAMLQAIGDIGGNEERGTCCAQMFLVFRKKDVNACQIEVTKMDIAIGDSGKPFTQVCGLRIARNEQHMS